MSGIRRAARLMRVCAAISFLLVAWMSLSPDHGGSDVEHLPVVNALAHIIMHFIVTACVMTGWHTRQWQAILFAAGVAVFMEVGQILVPGREVDLMELTGNLIGFGLGWTFFLSLRRFSHRAVI